MRRKGFTLVELLVVIGIIAVLIGILLPALQSAKRQANAVKCAAALREIGNCYQFYAQENKQWFPPAKTGANYRISYNSGIGGVNNDTNAAAFWYTFLAKYVTKSGRIGAAATTAYDRAQGRNNVLWGCPSFEGLANTAYNGNINYNDTGYGMNAFPEYTASYPAPAAPPNVLGDYGFSPALDWYAVATPTTGDNWATIAPKGVAPATAGNVCGTWYKQKAYSNPAERCLVSDARFWLLEVEAAPLDGTFPGQGIQTDQYTWATPNTDGQTLYDFYRHGTYPPQATGTSAGRYSPVGGKIAYNVLFADGHVSTLNDRAQGYKAARMRYPG